MDSELAKDQEFISAARQQWMDALTRDQPILKYVKQLTREELDELTHGTDGKEFIDKKTTGKEFLIEWHLFEGCRAGTPVIAQWRATDGGVLPGDRKIRSSCTVHVKRTKGKTPK